MQADHIRCRIGKVGISFIRLIFKMATNIIHENVGDSKTVVLLIQIANTLGVGNIVIMFIIYDRARHVANVYSMFG